MRDGVGKDNGGVGGIGRVALTGGLAFLDRYPFLVLGLLFVGALTSSSAAPLAGLFVVEGLGEPPWKLSMVAVVQVCVTLLTNRSFGRAIDRGVPVRILLISSILCFATGMVILGTFQIYWVYLCLVSILLGIGSGALSVMYSFGRLFAEQTGRDVVKFNSLLRIQTSLGWMIGPAASLSLFGAFGFTATYYSIAVLAGVWFGVCVLILPAVFRSHHPGSLKAGEKVPFNRGLVLACIPVYLIATGHVLFLTAMPLYFTTGLGLPPSSAGFELTVKCFVEVIAIYASARLIRRIGERMGLMIAAGCAVVFFILVYHAQTLLHVLALGALDGLYYGLFAAIGMTFVQNFARNRPGIATGYYVSTLFVGGLTGNLLMGTIAHWYSFHATVVVSGLIAAIGGLSLLVIRDAPQEEVTPQQA
ncbi:MFS transporter [Thalassospira sp.]|uniref:MFS transporter n=1 Tax=Thalassospira sp. TaxID=1912094 RepID=UPI002735E225|nr:MFS transporter [Thalassospira sp.]MDP2697522.1 MFS transporter [Thalassospira sp.]